MADARKKRFCVVRAIKDGAEVHRFETTGHSERAVERIEAGVIEQMNKQLYYCCDEDEAGKPWQMR